MAVHRVTKILPYAPAQLAALVADVRAYPDFLPWVTSMRVWNARQEAPGVSLLDAEAGVGFAMLKERFSTWVRHDANRNMVEVGLIRGPFKHLKNRWEFHVDPIGTRVEFMIDFAFKSRLLDLMLQANFDRAVDRLMQCFEAEAKRRYAGV
ncbi:MAG: type II toxin-antitoxin system RatA family toxin [Brevundimonas sp.]|uniref:type II toxin-antitoxin system RatA family toxin n=1 Tax=Brevundimonas sp. TaxID=1871086 RepID=UPI0025B865DE|nr:type II toxin-antitoxin system RatA family toxin [Brevundimonas sp.]MBX3476545.1 type II toxin-antitoxin system RatA family toxin [Brevundimonas sp.]